VIVSCVVTAPARAQDPATIGNAIAAACGGALPDAQTEAVVAGTVTDSVSGVALPRADVYLLWPAGEGVDSASVTTDPNGFFAFCGVPAGREVELIAHLRALSRPVFLDVEAGMLHVQPLRIPLSDPEKPGLLVGRVVDAESRKPVVGADVRLEEKGLQTLTNGHGYFSFGPQPWGAYRLRVSTLGYADLEVPVRVSGDLTQMAEIKLAQSAVELEGITVSVRPRARSRDMEGLVRRMNVGFGTFLTREVMERRPNARVTDLLREVPGVQVNTRGFTTYVEVRGAPCTPNVFVDGMPRMWAPEEGLDFFHSSDIEAVEVYKGWAEIPGEFVMPGQIKPCAAIAIWTRSGGP
jgi:hypothetical protein